MILNEFYNFKLLIFFFLNDTIISITCNVLSLKNIDNQ